MDACACNIDNHYNTGRINPPGIYGKNRLYFMHALYIHWNIKFFNSNIIAFSTCEYAFAKSFVTFYCTMVIQ